MKWEISGIWGDQGMPKIRDLDMPFFGYRSSPQIKLDISDLDIEIFTAFVLEWEFTRPPTRTEYSNSWFSIHSSLVFPNHPAEIIDVEILDNSWINKMIEIRTILRSGVADIYPSWVGLKSLKIVLAEFLDVPDFARIEESINFKTLTTRYESGHEQRRSKGNGRKAWTIILRKSSPYAEEVVKFFHEMQGQAKAFLWRNPLDGQRYRVRFANSRLDRAVLWGTENSFRIDLQEVRENEDF